MSRVILPPGKKPLATIRRVRDAADRVEDYGKLLEWLLVANFPKPETEKEQVFLGDYVQHYAYKFSAIADVNFALGVYNDIKHTNTKRGRPPEPDEIERAAKHLDAAIMQLLLTMPWPVQRAVFVDPYVQLAKKIGIAAVIGLAGYGLVSLVVPAVVKRPPSNVPRYSNPPMSQEELARQQWESVERSARETHVSIDQLEMTLAKWNQRSTELASNSDGRRIAGSTEAVRVLSRLLDRKRPLADEIKAMRADVDKAMKPLREVQKNRDYLQTEFGSAISLFERIRRRAWDEAAACNSALDTVNQLLSKAASTQPAAVSLKQAIDGLAEADRLAKAEAERKALEDAARARAEKAAMMAARMAAFEKTQAERRAEYQRLRALAGDEENKAKFDPFLKPGVRVPYRDYKGVRWRNEHGRTPGPATPMKYEWLLQARVLASVEDMIAVGTSSGNDRPKWNAPQSEVERREFASRFELLKQVAGVWHDMGLLGPRPERPHVPDPNAIAEGLKPLQGEWRERKEDYDFLVVGDLGVTTRSGKQANPVGGDMIRIEAIDGDSFRGSHYLQNGTWASITGKFITRDRIQITTEFSYSWTIERVPPSE